MSWQFGRTTFLALMCVLLGASIRLAVGIGSAQEPRMQGPNIAASAKAPNTDAIHGTQTERATVARQPGSDRSPRLEAGTQTQPTPPTTTRGENSPTAKNSYLATAIPGASPSGSNAEGIVMEPMREAHRRYAAFNRTNGRGSTLPPFHTACLRVGSEFLVIPGKAAAGQDMDYGRGFLLGIAAASIGEPDLSKDAEFVDFVLAEWTRARRRRREIRRRLWEVMMREVATGNAEVQDPTDVSAVIVSCSGITVVRRGDDPLLDDLVADIERTEREVSEQVSRIAGS